MKNLFLCSFFIFFACINYLTAQPVIQYQRAVGGSSDDYFSSMAVTPDGGVIAVGYSGSPKSGEKSEPIHNFPSHTTDYWVVKLNRRGYVEWDHSYGGNGTDAPTCVNTTADRGSIICGYSSSGISGNKTEANRGRIDYWIIKLNEAGDIEWDKTLGGEADDWPQTIIQTHDGGYMISGQSYSGMSGDKTDPNRGEGDDFWLIKLDASGNVEWQKTIGGSHYDEQALIQQTTDNGYILGGSSYSGISGEKTDTSKGATDYWVLKLDESGTIQWQKTIGGSGQDALASLLQDADGGYVLCGTSESPISGDKSQKSKGSFDYWVVKLGTVGDIEWDKTFGGSGYEGANYISQTRDSGYVIGGTSESDISGNKTEVNRGAGDAWIVKLNKHGGIIWDKTIGGASSENYGFSTQVNEILPRRYLLGCASSSGVSGDRNRESRGGVDYWFVQFDDERPSAKTSEPDNAITIENKAELKVYPNPAHNVVNIQSSNKTAIVITNNKGKTMLAKDINGSAAIDVTQWQAGVYFIKTAAGITQKFTVTH